MYGLSRSATALPWRIDLSSRAAFLSGGDALVISVPKSGRTWLRAFFFAYFCARFDHPFSLELERYQDARIPRVVHTYDLFEPRTKGRAWDRLRSAPQQNFPRAIGEMEISSAHFAAALELTEFAKMKELEAADAFDSKILRSRDKKDPDSGNVRRGKVGGFTDYLSTEDQAYAAAAVQKLHPVFGYHSS